MGYSARLFKDENGRTKFQIIKNAVKTASVRNEANEENLAPAKPFKRSIVAFVFGLIAMIYAAAILCYVMTHVFNVGHDSLLFNLFNYVSEDTVGKVNIISWILGIAAIIIGSNERHRHKDEEVKLAILGIKYGKIFIFLKLATFVVPWFFYLFFIDPSI